MADQGNRPPRFAQALTLLFAWGKIVGHLSHWSWWEVFIPFYVVAGMAFVAALFRKKPDA